MAAAPTFYVVPGSTVKSVIEAHRSQVFEAVKAAYHFHASGDSINPDSYFLRYPDKPRRSYYRAAGASRRFGSKERH